MMAGRRHHVPPPDCRMTRTLRLACWTLLLLLLPGPLTRANASYKVPVGLIFEERTRALEGVLEAAIRQFNAESRSFHLNAKSLKVNLADSFSVTQAVCNHLSEGAVVLIGVGGKAVSSSLRAYTRQYKVPFIQLNAASLQGEAEFGPPYHFAVEPSLTTAVMNVIETYDWNITFFLYKDEDAMERLNELFNLTHMLDFGTDFIVIKVTSAQEAADMLIERHLSDTNMEIRVILEMDLNSIRTIISTVKESRDTLKARFHFFVPRLNLRELKIKVLKIGGVNMTGFEMVVDESNRLDSYHHFSDRLSVMEHAVVLDTVQLLHYALKNLLQRHGGSRALNMLVGWGRPEADGVRCVSNPNVIWPNSSDLAQEIAQARFSGHSGTVAFDSNGRRTDFVLDVYETSLYLRAAKVGHWRNGEFTRQGPVIPTDKANRTIDNRTRIVVTIKEKPYVIEVYEPVDGHPVIGENRFSGYCSELAHKVSRIVVFDYHIRLVMDGEYGEMKNEGNWTGIIGELIRQEADISIAPLTITSKREKVLDFTKPFMSLGISIMIKKPQSPESHVFSFMEPLSMEIWLCTTFAFIGVSVVLFLVSRFSGVEWQVEGEEAKLTNDFTIGNSLWFSLGAFMQQGCDVLPKSVSGRIVTSVWWFFTLIIISSYTANLAAYLTTMRMNTPIKSAEDLAKQTNIRYGTRKVGSTKEFFQNSTVSLYQRMWSFMTSQPDVFEEATLKGIQRVRRENGKYAFLIESTTNDYHNNRQPCDTMKVGNNLDSKGYGMATPMGSDIKDQLTLAVLTLKEDGDLEKMRKYWWHANSECPKSEQPRADANDNSLTLTKVAGIFYILLVGLGLSVISAVFEFLYKTRKDSRKQNVSFGSEARTKFRMSISGHSDDESVGQRTPLKSTATFSYSGSEGRQMHGKTQTVV